MRDASASGSLWKIPSPDYMRRRILFRSPRGLSDFYMVGQWTARFTGVVIEALSHIHYSGSAIERLTKAAHVCYNSTAFKIQKDYDLKITPPLSQLDNRRGFWQALWLSEAGLKILLPYKPSGGNR